MATKAPARHGRTRRAQVTIELMLLIAMLFVVFVVLLNTSLGRNSIVQHYRIEFSARGLGDTIAAAINQVANAGDGAQMSFSLPSTLSQNTAYNATIYGSSRVVQVQWGGDRYVAVTTTSDVNASTLAPGTTITVRNTAGVVSLA